MTEQIVGYKLVEVANASNVLTSWGGVWGQCPGLPDIVILPNGDQLFGTVLNQNYQGYQIVPWMMEEPIIIPQVISDRQFFQQAALENIITKDEALAAVKTGVIPTVLQTFVDSIEDESQNFAAKMLLSGATEFSRYHPLTETIRTHLGWTTEQIDHFFIDAAKL